MSRMTRTPLVFNTQRFCLHDGPGIRTLVFLKGCPLRCAWCSNPESQSPNAELMHLRRLCAVCGSCAESCPEDAITMTDDGPRIDRERCTICGDCVAACPTGAMAISGTAYGVDELVALVTRDREFFETSGGGVTLTGGEPLAHPAFAADVLAALRDRRILTAIETCGCADWEAFERVLPHTDLFLFDLKHHGAERHREGTGVSNNRILGNLRKLASTGAEIAVRIPLIPGFNMDRDDVLAMARLAEDAGVRNLELMPYHRLGQGEIRRTRPGIRAPRRHTANRRRRAGACGCGPGGDGTGRAGEWGIASPESARNGSSRLRKTLYNGILLSVSSH